MTVQINASSVVEPQIISEYKYHSLGLRSSKYGMTHCFEMFLLSYQCFGFSRIKLVLSLHLVMVVNFENNFHVGYFSKLQTRTYDLIQLWKLFTLSALQPHAVVRAELLSYCSRLFDLLLPPLFTLCQWIVNQVNALCLYSIL